MYGDVFDLATAITLASEAEDNEAYAEAMNRLREYYFARVSAGAPDPMLTEALADYEDEPSVRIELYRLALSQSADFPGEPLYTKRTGLAECLIEVGKHAEAKVHLDLAQPEAVEAADEHQIEYIAQLLSRVAV